MNTVIKREYFCGIFIVMLFPMAGEFVFIATFFFTCDNVKQNCYNIQNRDNINDNFTRNNNNNNI